MNIEKTITLTILIIMWLTHARIMFFHKHRLSNKKNDKSFDPLYHPLLANLSFIGASLVQGLFIYLRVLDEPMTTLSLSTLITGVALYFFGLFLRIWAIKTLGKFFTFEIGIRPSHSILKTGPYKILRHPSYTGYLMMAAGFGLSLHSFIAFIILFFPALSFLLIRIYQEEKMLVTHFGKSYAEYQKESYKLIPFIF